MIFDTINTTETMELQNLQSLLQTPMCHQCLCLLLKV